MCVCVCDDGTSVLIVPVRVVFGPLLRVEWGGGASVWVASNRPLVMLVHRRPSSLAPLEGLDRNSHFAKDEFIHW